MEEKDNELYKLAEARVSFKHHLRVYIAINLLIWAFWFMFRARFGYYDGFWPVYATLGWGFGVYSHYIGAYKDNRGAIEKEMQKIKREREGNA